MAFADAGAITRPSQRVACCHMELSSPLDLDRILPNGHSPPLGAVRSLDRSPAAEPSLPRSGRDRQAAPRASGRAASHLRRAIARPCGTCAIAAGHSATHPDIHWVFPQPRPKDSDYSPNDAKEDYIEARMARAKAQGVYPPASGSDGIFIGAVRMLLLTASVTPALARRKVIIIGDAERMVSQLGSDRQRNAF